MSQDDNAKLRQALHQCIEYATKRFLEAKTGVEARDWLQTLREARLELQAVSP